MSKPAPIPPEELREIEKRHTEATPGPLEWHEYGGKEWTLRSERGMRPTVLDFVRRGMNGAAPRVNCFGIMRDFNPQHPDAVALASGSMDCLRLLAAHRALVEERDTALHQRDKLLAENEELRQRLGDANDRLADWEDDRRRVLDERCPSDERHCTCVPALRELVHELEGQLSHADEDRSHLQKCVEVLEQAVTVEALEAYVTRADCPHPESSKEKQQ